MINACFFIHQKKISTKDSFRIIMVIVAHYDLELHQMDVKTVFLNGDLFEDVYMVQPVGFQQMGNGNLVCKLKKLIYGLKQASRQWCIKFGEVIIRNCFKDNVVDRCIYMKVSGNSFIFLVLFVDDSWLLMTLTCWLRQSKCCVTILT